MDSIRRQARFAGFLYLLVAIIAPFAVFVIPGRMIVRGDAAATAERVMASESLYRLGMAAHLVSATLFLLVVLALYQLLKGVNGKRALVMLALAAVGIVMSLANELNNLAALAIWSRPEFLSVFEKSELDALGYLFLRLHGQGSVLASVFWGLWLFPFGALVIRSGFIPKIFGILVMVAGIGYVVSAATSLVLPQHAPLVGRYAMFLYFGELPIILWLLIRGANEPRTA
jgi:hypothetical protein